MRKINLMELRSTYGTGGGPEKTILLSAQKHDPERFNVLLVYLKGERDADFEISQRAKSMGLELIEIPEKGKFDFRSLKRILQLIEEHQIDILHGHDYKSDFFGCLISMINRRLKLIATTHGWIDIGIKQRFYNWLDLQALRHYHQVIAVSQETRNRLVRMGVVEERIIVVHNGIDIEEWRPEKGIGLIRKEFLIPADAPVVGVIGRLSKEKNLITLLDAASKVIKELPKAVFLIVGQGPEEENLKEYTRQLKIEASVIFSGHRSDLKNIYSTIDLLANTSKTEGICNSILEAQAMAKPVVGTDVGGNSEIIQDKLNGLLFAYQDLSGITQGMINLLKDKELSVKMGQAGRRIICERFSFDERLRRVENIYLNLMKKIRLKGVTKL